jgi:tetratricopeptide (TPR) repeat protein
MRGGGTVHRPSGLLLLLTAGIISLVPMVEAQQAEPIKTVRPKIIMVARPVDVASTKDTRNRWLLALIETYSRVRLDGREEFSCVPFEEMAGYLPSYTRTAAAISDADYMNLAKKLGAAFILFQKFEAVDKNGIMVNFYLELHQVPTDKVAASAEKNFPIEAIGQELDDCYIKMFKELQIQETERATAFYKVALIGIAEKRIRALGDALADDLYRESRDLHRAGQHYADLTHEAGDLPIALWLAGNAFDQARAWKESADNLGAFRSLAPAFPPVYASLAHSLRMAGRNTEAVNAVQQGRSAAIETVAGLVEELIADVALDKKDEAYAAALKVLSVNRAQPDALLFVTQWRNREGRFQEALALSDTLLTAAPANGMGYLEKARALIALKKPEAAIAPLQQAAVLLPKDPQPHLLLGDIYWGQKDYARAAASFESGLKLKADDLDLALKTADAFEQAGNAKAALSIAAGMEGKYGSDRRLAARIGILQFGLKDTAGAWVQL